MQKRTRRGATLVEVLIYILILSVLSVVVINLFVVMMRSFFDFRQTRQITHSASVALERMVRETRRATAIDLAQSNLGIHPGRLILQMSDGSVLTFTLTDGTLTIQAGTGPTISLTAPGVAVSDLVFRAFSTPVSKAVKIDLTLTATRPGGGVRSANFYGTAVLRGSY